MGGRKMMPRARGCATGTVGRGANRRGNISIPRVRGYRGMGHPGHLGMEHSGGHGIEHSGGRGMEHRCGRGKGHHGGRGMAHFGGQGMEPQGECGMEHHGRCRMEHPGGRGMEPCRGRGMKYRGEGDGRQMEYDGVGCCGIDHDGGYEREPGDSRRMEKHFGRGPGVEHGGSHSGYSHRMEYQGERGYHIEEQGDPGHSGDDRGMNHRARNGYGMDRHCGNRRDMDYQGGYGHGHGADYQTDNGHGSGHLQAGSGYSRKKENNGSGTEQMSGHGHGMKHKADHGHCTEQQTFHGPRSRYKGHYSSGMEHLEPTNDFRCDYESEKYSDVSSEYQDGDYYVGDNGNYSLKHPGRINSGPSTKHDSKYKHVSDRDTYRDTEGSEGNGSRTGNVPHNDSEGTQDGVSHGQWRCGSHEARDWGHGRGGRGGAGGDLHPHWRGKGKTNIVEMKVRLKLQQKNIKLVKQNNELRLKLKELKTKMKEQMNKIKMQMNLETVKLEKVKKEKFDSVKIDDDTILKERDVLETTEVKENVPTGSELELNTDKQDSKARMEDRSCNVNIETMDGHLKTMRQGEKNLMSSNLVKSASETTPRILHENCKENEHVVNKSNLEANSPVSNSKLKPIRKIKKHDLEKLVRDRVRKVEESMEKIIVELSQEVTKLKEKSQSLQQEIHSKNQRNAVKRKLETNTEKNKTLSKYKIPKKNYN